MSVTSLALGCTTLTCGTCGISFAVPDWWFKSRENDHAIFYCPNGHQAYFPGESEEERLRRQLRYAEQSKEAAYRREERLGYQLRAQKGVATRIKNRIARGVCPCCNRQFADLARHMTSKHPDYVRGESDE